ncbi:unnamed protein product [Callosobruchus maculatus]|uniref:Uncharacterized protein n=1 Tax=Callosobruchus maculatus TaxID=64391 RepID=A0A653D593_CALMS|nr:unnamed protein product [Callosobruchus maculatus]
MAMLNMGNWKATRQRGYNTKKGCHPKKNKPLLLVSQHKPLSFGSQIDYMYDCRQALSSSAFKGTFLNSL